MSQALWVACGAIGGATLAMVLFGMPLSAAAEVRCGTRVPRMRVVPVAADGSCLYHAVAHGLLRLPGASASAKAKGWVPGRPGERAGNLREVLGAYVRRNTQDDAGRAKFLALLQGDVEPDDTVEALLDRVEQRCGVESARCGWGQYGEIALLARMLGVCISVFSVFGPGRVAYETPFDAHGRAQSDGAHVRKFAGGCESSGEDARIMIVNRDLLHFDALEPCRNDA